MALGLFAIVGGIFVLVLIVLGIIAIASNNN